MGAPGRLQKWRAGGGRLAEQTAPGITREVKSLWLGVAVGEGDGTQLQYSCLGNPMEGGAWWAAVHGVSKSQTRLSDFPFIFHFHTLEKEMVFLPGESHEQRRLAGYSPQGHEE